MCYRRLSKSNSVIMVFVFKKILTAVASWDFIAAVRTISVTIAPSSSMKTHVTVAALVTASGALCTTTRTYDTW